MGKDAIYEIRIRETLSEAWSEWLTDLEIRQETGVDERLNTIITGKIDHSRLHGILARCRDLNLTVLSIHQKDE